MVKRKEGYILVVSCGGSEYVSAAAAADAEDFGHYDLTPGWKTPYQAVRIAEPDDVRDERLAVKAKEEAEAEA